MSEGTLKEHEELADKSLDTTEFLTRGPAADGKTVPPSSELEAWASSYLTTFGEWPVECINIQTGATFLGYRGDHPSYRFRLTEDASVKVSQAILEKARRDVRDPAPEAGKGCEPAALSHSACSDVPLNAYGGLPLNAFLDACPAPSEAVFPTLPGLETWVTEYYLRFNECPTEIIDGDLGDSGGVRPGFCTGDRDKDRVRLTAKAFDRVIDAMIAEAKDARRIMREPEFQPDDMGIPASGEGVVTLMTGAVNVTTDFMTLPCELDEMVQPLPEVNPESINFSGADIERSSSGALFVGDDDLEKTGILFPQPQSPGGIRGLVQKVREAFAPRFLVQTPEMFAESSESGEFPRIAEASRAGHWDEGTEDEDFYEGDSDDDDSDDWADDEDLDDIDEDDDGYFDDWDEDDEDDKDAAAEAANASHQFRSSSEAAALSHRRETVLRWLPEIVERDPGFAVLALIEIFRAFDKVPESSQDDVGLQMFAKICERQVQTMIEAGIGDAGVRSSVLAATLAKQFKRGDIFPPEHPWSGEDLVACLQATGAVALDDCVEFILAVNAHRASDFHLIVAEKLIASNPPPLQAILDRVNAQYGTAFSAV